MFFLFFLFFLFSFFNIYLHTKQKIYERFESLSNLNIFFIHSDDLSNILKQNSDQYYETFFEKDFSSRKIKTIHDYIHIIDKSVNNFNKEEKDKIIKCIQKANLLLNTLNDKNNNKKNMDWFQSEKVRNIKWKIGCIHGHLYEGGLPHTRNDIILISKKDVNEFSEDKLIGTLIHEKVHIYQKMYPEDIQQYLMLYQFSKWKKRDEFDNIRANPDLDQWIYQDSQERIYKSQYNDNPSSVEDIFYLPINHQTYEHPFEKMAIEIEDMLLK
jgi:hypothetical protein